MTGRSRVEWLAIGAVLLVAIGLAGLTLLALARTTVLVDAVPGADAGIATSPALEAARSQALLSGLTLLALGAATGIALLVKALRRRPTG
jgi:hypothetical protein